MDLANRIFTALEAHDESEAESERRSYEDMALLVEAKSAELRAQEALEPPPTWHRYVNGSIRTYMNVGALSVWKFTMGKGYRWQIESTQWLPDPTGGVCATEEEAKETAIKAARGQLPEDYDSFKLMREDDE